MGILQNVSGLAEGRLRKKPMRFRTQSNKIGFTHGKYHNLPGYVVTVEGISLIWIIK